MTEPNTTPKPVSGEGGKVGEDEKRLAKIEKHHLEWWNESSPRCTLCQVIAIANRRGAEIRGLKEALAPMMKAEKAVPWPGPEDENEQGGDRG